MKKYAIVPLLLFFFACNDDISITPILADDPEDTTVEPTDPLNLDITGYTIKEFNLNNGRISDSIFYALDGFRTIYGADVQMNTREIVTTENTFIGRRLSETATFYNGEPRTLRTFSYSRDGLTEMTFEVIRNNNANQIYQYTYIHTADTIFMALEFGFDYRNLRPVEDAKLVLDENDNIVFYENYNRDSERTVRVHIEFDSNNNPVTETHELVDDDTAIPFRTDNIVVGESRNPLYNVLEGTYGKKTLMMLYHIQVNDLSRINARTISPNTITSISSNANENRFSFEIENQVSDSGYSELSNFKTFTMGELSSHFEIEFRW